MKSAPLTAAALTSRNIVASVGRRHVQLDRTGHTMPIAVNQIVGRLALGGFADSIPAGPTRRPYQRCAPRKVWSARRSARDAPS
jgi:hypothetical protein